MEIYVRDPVYMANAAVETCKVGADVEVEVFF